MSTAAGPSCFTIVRNEELLIAKHLIGLAHLSRDVVCVVQPSNDATALIARHVAEQLADVGVTLSVVDHAPARPGKEFSLALALERCASDWCFNLDADETYAGVPLEQIVAALGDRADAFAVPHWHAIAANPRRWFKVEAWVPRVRLVNRRAVVDPSSFDLHKGLDFVLQGARIVALDRREARILEYKAPWQHYVDQLFYRSQGCALNEVEACERTLARRDLQLGQAVFDGFFAGTTAR